ncbi:hypothetical protein KY290_034961 [Solanum tuberosum]|uniref:Uncharacterized protein n=1 Tax=Solanum tuberosum TaxID=4113 RepID=A0ABQ7U6H0_SOLTU|nr:hypothetical protein KY289_034322 [Solanum tuberosum]KAH0646128.1 hypothetical protein KY284_034012 [Solanum tuberosum]KAH0648951.1 hypothetical protein KY285_034199 [Solanum tuberosum]KAH0741918.1 hypothetical protein KY290_034961 [Solanum tuberosum]
MDIRMPRIIKKTSTAGDVPKGHFAVYVGEKQKKRFDRFQQTPEALENVTDKTGTSLSQFSVFNSVI